MSAATLGFAPHRGIAAAAFRAVQSTPLLDYSGRMLGMVSTHFRRPGRPPDRDLQVLEYYGDFVGQAIVGQLSAIPAGDHDSIGRPWVCVHDQRAYCPGDGQARLAVRR
jgi:hypothetical protein